jgi:hypothetical protein
LHAHDKSGTSARNPIADLLADAIALAVSRPDVIEAMRTVFAPAHVELKSGGLVARSDAAQAHGVSVSTLDRLTSEGAPVHAVGGRRRYDVTELRAWLDARGQRPANAKPKAVDVDDVLRRSGLRAIGGPR